MDHSLYNRGIGLILMLFNSIYSNLVDVYLLGFSYLSTESHFIRLNCRMNI